MSDSDFHCAVLVFKWDPKIQLPNGTIPSDIRVTVDWNWPEMIIYQRLRTYWHHVRLHFARNKLQQRDYRLQHGDVKLGDKGGCYLNWSNHLVDGCNDFPKGFPNGTRFTIVRNGT